MMTDDLGQRLTDRMTKSERDQTFPPLEPRDAATIMLIDRTGATPKVLLGRRHDAHKFMPGKFVFPGGRIEPDDRTMSAINELHPDTQAKLLERVADPNPALARGFALAAVRELAEETGLLLGVQRDTAPVTPSDLWKDFANAKVHPDLSQMHFVGRAITPQGRPKRFDTRFFTADLTGRAHTIDGIVGPEAELVELVWMPVDEAATLDMPTITSVILEELGARVRAGMAPSLPVPMYQQKDGKFFRELL